MDKLILISIPETSIKSMIEQAVSKAFSEQKSSSDTNTKTVLDFAEACKYIGISKSHGYKLTSQGLIPFSKRGRKNYFDKDKLDQWLLGNVSKDQKTLKEEAQNLLKQRAK